ncbi:MAG: hypothetical protein RLZ92_2048 [Pseudomonadota bacterium]|jgi:antitoxin CptB
MNEIKQLRWRCRRGTLELDLILLRYLDNDYPIVNKPEQLAFQQLLGLEDVDLMSYLMANKQPADQHLLTVISQLQNFSRVQCMHPTNPQFK